MNFVQNIAMQHITNIHILMKKSKFFVRRTINMPAAHNRPIAALPPPRFVNSEIPRLILANNSIGEKLETTLY
ncbi:MAG: hypothetical protein CMM76_15695 [Rhodospirillaceae bacterium]|nr:hypothetical protein [Rhodospirillaceae bacterium]